MSYDRGEVADLKMSEEHIIISYSPFNTDLAKYKDQPILIIGDPQEKVNGLTWSMMSDLVE